MYVLCGGKGTVPGCALNGSPKVPSVHYWAVYEYRMYINGECWNIVTDEDMNKPPSGFPGSQPTRLTHDFCHLDPQSCDEAYTNFSFVEMGGRRIWPFYVPENDKAQLWVWISPRRFAIISNHPSNEKLNHFYSNKMHDHHILALRTPCWVIKEIESDSGKLMERTIVLSEDTRRRSSSHETFATGFEGKYGRASGGVPMSFHMASVNIMTQQAKELACNSTLEGCIVLVTCKH